MPHDSEIHEQDQNLHEGATSTIFQFVTTWLERGFKRTKDNVAWEQAVRNYIHRWIDRWGYIKPLGADHPIPLHEIYVSLNAVPRQFVKRFASVQEMQAAAGSDRRWTFFDLVEGETQEEEYKPQPGITIANNYERLNLLGAPGSGKSTFLRRLGLEALLPRATTEGHWRVRGHYEHSMLPVLLELRILGDTPCERPPDIVNLLANEFVKAGFPDSIRLLLAALRDGALLILLDGVDEIHKDQLASSIGAMRDFISRYPRCRYVISCRTAFYRDWFNSFHDFVLTEFNQEQVKDFAHRWFARPQEEAARTADNFLTLLYSEEHRANRELARSPLLLTLLCLVFRNARRFPPNRAQLYDQALLIYLREWNETKGLRDDHYASGLAPEMEIEFLKAIAGPAFIKGTLFFTGEELRKAIRSFLVKELNAPQTLTPSQILNAIAVKQGLLIERAHDLWTFSHLTIHEYLAAKWILDEGHVKKSIVAHVEDDRWREVFLLISGLTRADDLLRTMMNSADLIVSERPSLLFRQFSVILDEVSTIADETWRSFDDHDVDWRAIGATGGRTLLRAIILETCCPEHQYACALTFARAHGFAFDQNKALSIREKINVKSHRSAERLRMLPMHAGDSLFVEDLNRYMRVTNLICLCKEAALRVSRGTWDAICRRLFASPVIVRDPP